VEYPHLQEIFQQLGGTDFTVLSIETTNRPELARKFVQEIGATFPIALDEQKSAGTTFQLRGVPTNLLIDREGNVVFRHLGFAPGHEKILEAEVKLLMGSGSTASKEDLGALLP
jgi:hypothetical protein